ncbi:hypothetical protein GZ77_00125 [Endozoicomonas montiporae]|uniref:Uncharacterized protein n=3 Tax=Endozoicomonas montiporae TaxID=1027273 RepID=A0A081N9M6_9GAMM|nr:hypothetical protein EZMO1_0775 [Endozoicomonas montiporae CL-33]KEQ15149.1 hypothetical protein GZ77_00125 [Endozoicomonas montiporae]
MFLAAATGQVKGHEAIHAAITVKPLLSQTGTHCALIQPLDASAITLLETRRIDALIGAGGDEPFPLATEVSIGLLASDVGENGSTSTVHLTYNTLSNKINAVWNMVIFAVSAYLQLPERAGDTVMTVDTLLVGRNNEGIQFISASGRGEGKKTQVTPCHSQNEVNKTGQHSGQGLVAQRFQGCGSSGGSGDEPPDKPRHTGTLNCPLCNGYCDKLERKCAREKEIRTVEREVIDKIAECFGYRKPPQLSGNRAGNRALYTLQDYSTHKGKKLQCSKIDILAMALQELRADQQSGTLLLQQQVADSKSVNSMASKTLNVQWQQTASLQNPFSLAQANTVVACHEDLSHLGAAASHNQECCMLREEEIQQLKATLSQMQIALNALNIEYEELKNEFDTLAIASFLEEDEDDDEAEEMLARESDSLSLMLSKSQQNEQRLNSELDNLRQEISLLKLQIALLQQRQQRANDGVPREQTICWGYWPN